MAKADECVPNKRYDLELCFEYSEQLENEVEQQQSLDFLLACKRYGIIPKRTLDSTIELEKLFKYPNLQRRFEVIRNNFHKQIFYLEIAQTKANLKETKRKLCQLRLDLQNNFTRLEYDLFMIMEAERMKELTVNIAEKQQQELNALKENHFNKIRFYFDQNCFENKTKIDIPWASKWLLSLGEDFALPIVKRKFSALQIIADIEECIQEMDKNKEKTAARKNLARSISEYKLNNKERNAQEKFILAVFGDTKDFLQRQKNLVITRTYKSNKTVAVYRQEYENKIEELLEDKNTYRISRTDPTNKSISVNNAIIADLYKKEKIDIILKSALFCAAASAPRIEILPLIYKDTVIMKPSLVFSTQVPGYQLSKLVQGILKNIISKQFNVKSSLELKEQLKGITIEENDCLASFKLFSNIPLKTVTHIIYNKWKAIEKFTDIPLAKFQEIINFCLYENRYFVYGNEVFNQTNGLPVGHLLEPVVVDIFMDNLIEAVAAKLDKLNIHVKYMAKNAEHILAVIKTADKEKIFDILNAHHRKINFTLEIDSDRKIIFLDAQLYRGNNDIKFDWHTNEDSAGIINFCATLAKTQIINTAKNLIQKVLDLSDEQFHEQNLKKLRKILKIQSFPPFLIEHLIKSHKTATDDYNPQAQQARSFKYCVKYIPGLTDPKSLRAIVGKNYINHFGYEPYTTLSGIFTNTRAPVNKLQQNNVVYEIPCKGNGSINCHFVYIGVTKRSLTARMREHKADIKKNSDSTALSQHVNQTNHVADFENIKILDVENNERKLYIKESLRIQQKLTRTMNIKKDTDKSGVIYRPVL